MTKQYSTFARTATMLVVSATLAGTVFQGCSSEPAQTGTFQEKSPLQVQVLDISSGLTQRDGVRISGVVQAADKVSLSTKIMGTISSLTVQEGQSVSAGQTIAVVDDRELKAKLAQVESGINEAKAHFTNIKINLNRIQELYKTNAATKRELDDITAQSEAMAARIQTAENQRRELTDLLSYTVISAPISGVITAKFVEKGAMASPGMPIVMIENVNNIEIAAGVPEQYINALSIGDSLQAEINGSTITARIRQIVPSADAMSHQFTVIATLPSGLGVKPGMYARVLLPTTVATAQKDEQSSTSGDILLPKEALVYRGQLTGVYIVDSNNKALLRWLRVVPASATAVKVLTGLSGTEKIIMTPPAGLSDGHPVTTSPVTAQ